MKEIIKNKIEELLSKEYCCSIKELSEKATIYSVNTKITQPYIKIMAYKNCVVVCTSKDLSSKVQELLQHKNRDEIFELPLVYGQTIHYVPDIDCMQNILVSSDYEYEFFAGNDILTFNGLTGFENSLAFDETGSTLTKFIYIAKDNGNIIGIAGAVKSSLNGVWEIGVDVLEEYRGAKLGTYLVRRLTSELLTRNLIPFYSASITNIGSQMVASRCGYIPIWVDTFGTILDGNSVYNDIVRSLALGFTK